MLDALLSDYLGEFAAAEKPTEPSQPSLTRLGVSAAQTVLTKLGEKVGGDGLFGPTTKGAWGRQAKKLGKNPAFDRAAPNAAWVSLDTYETLSRAAYPAAAAKVPVAPKVPAASVKSAVKGTVDRPVLELQNLLFGVGWTTKKLTRDGLFGPQTKRAWGVSAKTRKLPDLFERVDGRTARVAQSTYEKIKSDGKTSSAAPAVSKLPVKSETTKTSPSTGLIDRSVSELQGILYGVGWTTKKLKSDGLYGAQTKNAWAGSAKLRGLSQTFERVDGRTARVDATTYEALKAKMPATKAGAAAVVKTELPKPVAGKTGVVPPAGLVDRNIAELQGILYGVGWTTKKLKNDGLYGAQTKTAWAGSAKLRGLSQVFERVDGRTARVDATTYEALKAKMPATKVGAASATSPASTKPSVKSSAKTSPSTGLIDRSVSELQGILYGVGWTTKKLKSDGLYGAQTKNAWAGSAKLRGLSQTFERVDGRTARVDATTYEALKAKMPATKAGAGAGAAAVAAQTPKPEKVQKTVSKDAVTKPVLETQKILQALGVSAKKVPANGKYDANVRDAWSKQASARGLDSSYTKVDPRTAKLSASTFAALKGEVDQKRPDTPKPKSGSELSPEAKALLKVSTSEVSAEQLQQAMARWASTLGLPPSAVTGVWDQASTEMFFRTFGTDVQKQNGPAGLQIWREGFPSLVSADGRRVKLPPAYATAVPTLAQLWVQSQQQQAPAAALPPAPPEPRESFEPAQQQPPQQSSSGSSGPAPTPFYDSAGSAPPGGEAFEPEAAAAAPPSPEAAKENPGEKTWSGAVAALQSLTQKAPVFEKAFAEAKSRGDLHPDVQAAAQAWVDSANTLMGKVAEVISGSPELRAALDVSGPGVGFAGVSGWGSDLGALFGELEAVAEKAVELLRTPIPSLTSLRGLGQAVPPQAAGVGARLALAGWARLMELLKLPVVTAAGAVAMGGQVISDSIHGETEAYLSHEAALDQLVAEGKLTVDEYQAMKKEVPKQGSIIGPVVLGVVALGGLALYFNKPRFGGKDAPRR